jgi:glutamate dehydrogenase (NAD(P)+)
MGTNEQIMAWIMDTYSQHAGKATPAVVTGKPVELGGSALRRESTGRGVVYCIEEAAREIKLDLRGATFALHGFGNVGSVAAAEMVARGAKCIAVADVTGGYINRGGISLDALHAHFQHARTLDGFTGADRIAANDVLTVPCDVLIPAATGQVITARNAPNVRCRILAEGANAPTMPDADPILLANGIHIIPDVLCNAGGVTVSYFEWVQSGMQFFWSEAEIDERLSKLMKTAFHRVRNFATERGIPNRMAAICLGINHVDQVMRRRGLYA